MCVSGFSLWWVYLSLQTTNMHLSCPDSISLRYSNNCQFRYYYTENLKCRSCLAILLQHERICRSARLYFNILMSTSRLILNNAQFSLLLPRAECAQEMCYSLFTPCPDLPSMGPQTAAGWTLRFSISEETILSGLFTVKLSSCFVY